MLAGKVLLYVIAAEGNWPTTTRFPELRSAYRDQYPEENLSDNVGFRVARTLAP